MGFRSTFTTLDDPNLVWPEWFVQKHESYINFREKRFGTISSKWETKPDLELAEDIQRCLIESPNSDQPFVIAYLHECRGVTRCEITREMITWTEPEGWWEVEAPGTHDYCYGCSDAKMAGSAKWERLLREVASLHGIHSEEFTLADFSVKIDALRNAADNPQHVIWNIASLLGFKPGDDIEVLIPKRIKELLDR
jgi:hypothetical protein